MKKEEKVMKECTVTHRYCDVCGNIVDSGSIYIKSWCSMCGKDICRKHQKIQDTRLGDEETFCESWLGYRKKYRDKIEEYEKEIDKLYDDYLKEC